MTLSEAVRDWGEGHTHHSGSGRWMARSHLGVRMIAPSPTAAKSAIESRWELLEQTLEKVMDIGLQQVRLLEQIQEGDGSGIGAIHSLNQGHVVLDYPLIYSSRFVDEEVMVSIEEFGVYGVGATESEAVQEVKSELWDLFQDLQQTPSEELGPHLATTLRVLRARIRTE